MEVEDLQASPVRVLVDGEPVEVDTDQLPALDSPGTPTGPGPAVTSDAQEAPATPTPAAARVFRTPMPGIIVSVAVAEGAQVVTGDEVCVLEAMKMHQTLRADWTGIVRAVHVRPGQQVLDGDPIVELE